MSCRIHLVSAGAALALVVSASSAEAQGTCPCTFSSVPFQAAYASCSELAPEASGDNFYDAVLSTYSGPIKGKEQIWEAGIGAGLNKDNMGCYVYHFNVDIRRGTSRTIRRDTQERPISSTADWNRCVADLEILKSLYTAPPVGAGLPDCSTFVSAEFDF